MRYKTHVAFSILIFFIVDFYYPFEDVFIALILFVLFSILPDFDLHTSYIGNKVKALSYLFEVVLKHRGFLHSIWAFLLLYLIMPSYKLTAFGYLSHVLLDALNKKGVSLFWPYMKIKGPFLAGKFVDNVLFYCLFGIDLFIVLI